MSEQENKTTEGKVGIGGYISLVFAIVFFSGVCAGNHWWAIFDFSTLNGAFGKLSRALRSMAKLLRPRPVSSAV